MASEDKLQILSLHVDRGTLKPSIVHNTTIILKNGKMLELPETVWNGQQPVKKELLDTLQLMIPHMLLIIGLPQYKIARPNYLTEKAALTDEKLKGYFVNGFSISDKGVLTIKGGIKSKEGKVTPLNAHTFTNPDTSNYPFLDNLNSLHEEANEQLMEYFIDGNFGDGGQPDLWQQGEEPQKVKKGEEQEA